MTTTLPEPFLKQLALFRKALIRISIIYSLCVLILLFYSQSLYLNFVTPLMKHLPGQSYLIATSLISPMMIPLKFAAYLSLFLLVPYVFLEFWVFVKPGLYQREKKIGLCLIISTLFLFYGGALFCYEIVFPCFLTFVSHFAGGQIRILPDIEQLLSFSAFMLIAFGIAFETPLIFLGLILLGLVSLDKIRSLRPYVLVGAFIVGMLLTPPDVISQILLAVPIYLFYEIALLMAGLLMRQQKKAQCLR